MAILKMQRTKKMSNISSGIETLDSLIDSFYVGDNVVWEIDAGTPFDVFIKSFIARSVADKKPIIYVSFNRSPQTIINEVTDVAQGSFFILLDCFSSGKGKNDETFMRFYNHHCPFKVIRSEDPSKIEEFTTLLNSIEDSLEDGARYIFDSLTGMQDLWGDEGKTYKFFTYMCPRLFDLGTVAYWILEEEAHSKNFRANLKHITQVVFSLFRRTDKIYIKALKMTGRPQRGIFKPHQVFISDDSINITYTEQERHFHIGDIVKDLRTKRDLSQKDLSDRLKVTASFISQLENNQISPSIHSLIQLCKALDVNPAIFFNELYEEQRLPLIFRKVSMKDRCVLISRGIVEYPVISGQPLSAKIISIDTGVSMQGHFTFNKRPELIFVLRGRIDLLINGQREVMNIGDAMLLKDDIPTLWENKGGDVAEILIVW